MTWVANPDFSVTPITDPMSDVTINISAPETITGFTVKVESPSAEFIGTVAAMVSPDGAMEAVPEPAASVCGSWVSDMQASSPVLSVAPPAGSSGAVVSEAAAGPVVCAVPEGTSPARISR